MITVGVVVPSSVALANGAGVCALETDNDPDLQWEVASTDDLGILESDAADCSNKTIFQTADIDLDGWTSPVETWFGTFNGNGFEFFDSGAGSAEAPLFTNFADNVEITDVTRHGDVTGGGDYVGGLVGTAFGVLLTITDSRTTGDVTGAGNSVGGLVGATEFVAISGSYTTGDIVGVDYVGGLIGSAFGAVTITESYTSGAVVGEDSVGGMLGENGEPYDVIVTDSYTMGDVTGAASVGGLVGEAFYPVTISRSFTNGDITGDVRVGGLAGNPGSAAAYAVKAITDSYATGDVSGTDSVGGLVGDAFYLDFVSSYSVSVVENSANAGALIGADYTSVSNHRSFGLTGAPGCGVGLINVCVPPDQLKSRSFLEAESWDLEGVWCLRGSLNDGFPVLRTIDFGPGDTSNCKPRSASRLRTVTFDPVGGTCGAKSAAWTETFRRSISLPMSADCRRDGYVLLGWTRDPGSATPDDLLTGEVSNSGNLTAVWGALPTAPSSVVVMANAWCTECTSVLVVWQSVSDPSNTAVVSINGRMARCAVAGEFNGQRWCWISELVSGMTHTVSVAWQNQHGVGPAVDVVFALG